MATVHRNTFYIIGLSTSSLVCIFNVSLLLSLCFIYYKLEWKSTNEAITTKPVVIYSLLSILFYSITPLISLIYNLLIIYNNNSVGITEDHESGLVCLEILFWSLGHIFYYLLALKRFYYLYNAPSNPDPKHKRHHRYLLVTIIFYLIITLGFTVLLLLCKQHPNRISRYKHSLPNLNNISSYVSMLYFFGALCLNLILAIPLLWWFIKLLIEATTALGRALSSVTINAQSLATCVLNQASIGMVAKHNETDQRILVQVCYIYI